MIKTGTFPATCPTAAQIYNCPTKITPSKIPHNISRWYYLSGRQTNPMDHLEFPPKPNIAIIYEGITLQLSHDTDQIDEIT